MSSEFKKYSKELAEKISKKQLTNKKLEQLKIKLAKKYNLKKIPKNPDILMEIDNPSEKIRKALQIKPVRTGSGVANIAVMINEECPGSCIYCPKGDESPQSYTGVEPVSMRALRVDYDPYKQVKNRLKQLRIIGHKTDKCELIIMGATFPSIDYEKQREFIKNCLDALNEKKSKTFEQAKQLNEKAKYRCIGLTLETRPDYLPIKKMLDLGCTRVEIGVQAVSDKLLKKVKRGHNLASVKKATKQLKDSGLKVTYHMMLGLTGLTKKSMEKEVELFNRIFIDQNFRPDELKIYPLLVIPGTEIHKMWLAGEYDPLTVEETKQILKKIKQQVPEYVRIKRIMRDISQEEVDAGPAVTNLRQLVKQNGWDKCRCIRCREPLKKGNLHNHNIGLVEKRYKASGGQEVFLSFEDTKKDIIVGFLRLRLTDKALVRELHVYGTMAQLGSSGVMQHKGFGHRLLKRAEEIAKENKLDTIQITSGIGVREYYRKFGYKLVGNYMIKKI